MNITMDKLGFIFINICLPFVLSIIYSKNPKGQQTNYELTKGAWYLIYGGVVAFDYLFYKQSRYIAGFTLTLTIIEGAPLILKRLFNIDVK